MGKKHYDQKYVMLPIDLEMKTTTDINLYCPVSFN